MAEISEWKAIDEQNVELDGYALSNPYQHVTRKLMGAIKRKFNDVDVEIAGIAGAYTFKGTVDTVDDLPETGNNVGDVYNVTSGTDGGNYAWDGAEWDKTGDSLVDVNGAQVLASGTTFPRTLGERFAEALNVLDFGAKGDGETDDTDALEAAFLAGIETGKTVFIPSGTYNFTSIDLRYPRQSLSIYADHATLFCTDQTAGEYGALSFRGGVAGGYGYAAAIVEGAMQLQASEWPDLAPGDFIGFKTNQLVPTDSRCYWQMGTICKIRDFDSTTGTVTLTDPFPFSVAAAGTEVLEVTAAQSVYRFSFGGVDADERAMQYPCTCTSSSGANLGETRSLCFWNNATKAATFAVSSEAASTGNNEPWPAVPAVGDKFTLSRTASNYAMYPIGLTIRGSLTVTTALDTSETSSSADGHRGIYIDYADMPLIDGLTVQNFSGAQLTVRKCYKPEVSRCILKNGNRHYSSTDGTGNGLVDFGSYAGFYHDIYITGCRSGFTTTGADCISSYAVLDNIKIDAGNVPSFMGEERHPLGSLRQYGFGGHGNSLRLTYRNIAVKDCFYGASLRDTEAVISNCQFAGTVKVGLLIQGCDGLTVCGCSFFPNTTNLSGANFSIHKVRTQRVDAGWLTFLNNIGVVSGGFVRLEDILDLDGSTALTVRRVKMLGNIVTILNSSWASIGMAGTGSNVLADQIVSIDNLAMFPNGSAYRGWLRPRSAITIVSNGYVQTGLRSWCVRLASEGSASVDLGGNDTLSHAITISNGSGDATAVDVMLYDVDGKKEDLSPFAGSGSNVSKINVMYKNSGGTLSSPVSGKLNIYVDDGFLHMINKTGAEAWFSVFDKYSG